MTLIALKRGLLTAQAVNYIGELYVNDLGLGEAVSKYCLLHLPIHEPKVVVQGIKDLPQIPSRMASSHKGDIGLVLAIGGNIGMPGAIRLAAEASLRCGAALLAVSCHKINQNIVVNGRPELMLAPFKVEVLSNSVLLTKAKVLLIGPGLGQDKWAQQIFALAIKHVIHRNIPCIIDADALTLLSKTEQYYQNWVLTPHPGEAAKLLHCTIAQIEEDRFAAAKRIVDKYGGICVLKGAGSLICDGKKIVINSSGNAGMASGGMGDILAGVIAALVLQMPHIFEAVKLAVYIHGAAGDNIADKSGQRGMLASDLFIELQQMVN